MAGYQSTYRVQLSRAFPFAAARRVVPYLADLGVSHLYTSPILRARSGSAHGYDVVDPAQVSPELGGETGTTAWA
jgi:(1->4)-alpha-D-glucan 1-alpha-D-glucosylmutase